MPNEFTQIEKLGRELNDEVVAKANTEVTRVVNTLIRRLRTEMERRKVWGSGNLVQSIEPFAEGDEFGILMDKYYKYVDRGVSGTMRKEPGSHYKYTTKKPPVRAFVNYLKFKSEKPILKRAFIIRELVFKYGIRGRHFIDAAFDDKFINELLNK